MAHGSRYHRRLVLWVGIIPITRFQLALPGQMGGDRITIKAFKVVIDVDAM